MQLFDMITYFATKMYKEKIHDIAYITVDEVKSTITKITADVFILFQFFGFQFLQFKSNQ